MARRRLESLDVFRGLTVAAMIVVNHPGDWSAVFAPLQHAPWNGCTFADLVFPCFLVIMGMAMPLSFARRREDAAGAGAPRTLESPKLVAVSQVSGLASDRCGPRPSLGRRPAERIVMRAGALLGLGLLLNAIDAWPDVSGLRIPGVLQRIAITYAIAAPIVLHLRVRTQAAIAAGLLVMQWALLSFAPFHPHAPGLLMPGDNLAAHLDRLIFGGHVLAATGDPEGVLGTPTSVATTLLGAIAGQWIQATPNQTRRLAGLAAGAVVGIVAGLTWSMTWPLNKTLWTGSFALYASGLSLIAYVVVARIVDERRPQRWTRPFLWLGVSPLAIYFGSELLGHLMDRPFAVMQATTRYGIKELIYWRWLVPVLPWHGQWASLTFALGYAGLWTIAAGLLHRRAIVAGA